MGSYRWFTSLCSDSDSECGPFYLAFDLQCSVPRILYYSFFFEIFLVIYVGCCCTQSRIGPCIHRLLYKIVVYRTRVSCIHSRIYPIASKKLGKVCLSLSSLFFFACWEVFCYWHDSVSLKSCASHCLLVFQAFELFFCLDFFIL